jgi:Restriction endonuclease S subunits
MASSPRRLVIPKAATRWNVHRFDQMAHLVNDRVYKPADSGVERYVGLEHLDPDSLRIHRWGEITDVESTKLRFQPGDIIFGKRRVYQRKVAVADFEGICSAHAMVLRARPDVVLPEFLPLFMQSDRFMERALEVSVGSLSPTINWTTLAREEFTLPPIDEQRHLVGALHAALAVKERLYETELALGSAEYALLKTRFGATYHQPAANVPLVALSELADIRTGLAKGRRPDEATTTRPYLSVANVKDGYLDLTEVRDIVVDRDKVDRYALKHGDVLMTEGGDLDKLGRGTVWQEQIPECLHQNHIFAARVDMAQLDPWYLAALARSPYGRSYFLRCAKRSSNLASVNKGQVSALLVPLHPLAEQKEWLRSYSELRRVLATTIQRRVMIHAMMKEILEANTNGVHGIQHGRSTHT